MADAATVATSPVGSVTLIVAVAVLKAYAHMPPLSTSAIITESSTTDFFFTLHTLEAGALALDNLAVELRLNAAVGKCFPRVQTVATTSQLHSVWTMTGAICPGEKHL